MKRPRYKLSGPHKFGSSHSKPISKSSSKSRPKSSPKLSSKKKKIRINWGKEQKFSSKIKEPTKPNQPKIKNIGVQGINPNEVFDILQRKEKKKGKKNQISSVELKKMLKTKEKEVYRRKIVMENGEILVQFVEIKNETITMGIYNENAELAGFLSINKLAGSLYDKELAEKIPKLLKNPPYQISFVKTADSYRKQGLALHLISEGLHIMETKFHQKEIYLRCARNEYTRMYKRFGFDFVKDKKGKTILIEKLPLMKKVFE